MSPQTRRGRAVPPSRKTRGRADAGSNPPLDESSKGETPIKGQAPAKNETPVVKTETPDEPHTRAEIRRAKAAPARRKKQHGTAYRWIVAYLPILALLFGLLGIVWVYTSYINPPPPTPAQQWAKIEAKWSPARETARQAVSANTLGFAKQQAAYKDFYTQTKGWVDEVKAVTAWGVGANEVTTFLSDGGEYVSLLQQVNAATTPNEVASMSATLIQWDQAFTADVAAVERDFALAVASPAPPTLAFPSVNPTPTDTPAPTGSPAATGSPVATPSPAPTPTGVASPTSTPS